MSIRIGGRGIRQRMRVRAAAAAAGPYVYTNAEASALAARFTTPPTNARAALIDNLIGSLKSASVWTLLDTLYITAAADAQAAQRNWIADSFNLTETGTITFTADRGYAGDGSTGYLDTAFNATTAPSTKLVRDSAHLGFWSRTSAQGVTSGEDMGASSNLKLGARNVSDGMTIFCNNALIATASSITDGSGHFIGARPTSAGVTAYRNGVALSPGPARTSTAPVSGVMSIGSNGTNFSTRQFAAAHFGSSLTAQNASDLYTALATYMTAVGA